MKEFSDPVRQQLLNLLRSKGLVEPQALRYLKTPEREAVISEIEFILQYKNHPNYNRFSSLGSVNPTLVTDFGEAEDMFTGESKNKQFRMIPIRKEQSLRLTPLEEIEHSQAFRAVRELDPSHVDKCLEKYHIDSNISVLRQSIENLYRLHQDGSPGSP